MLTAFEYGFNALLREELDPEERTACYVVHDLLRLRASGAAEKDETTPSSPGQIAASPRTVRSQGAKQNRWRAHLQRFLVRIGG